MTQDTMSDDLPVTPENMTLTDVKKEQLAQASELKRKLLGEKSATEEGPTATEIQEQRYAANSRSYDLLTSKLAAREEKLRNSWVGRSGLQPGGVAASALDSAAMVVSGLGTVTGHAFALAPSIIAALQEAGTPDNVKEAYTRYIRGEQTEEDMALLNQNQDLLTTNLRGLQNADHLRRGARGIVDFFDFKGTVHAPSRESQAAEFRLGAGDTPDQVAEGWDKLWDGDYLDGATQMAKNLPKVALEVGKAAVTNPISSATYAMENVPQVAIGLLGKGAMAATNVGYGMDLVNQGMEAYAEDNDGARPTGKEFREILLRAGAAAGAEHVGDAHIFKSAIAPLTKAGAVANKAVPKAARGLVGGVAKAATTVTTTGSVEGATEAFQTYQEGKIKGRPETPMAIAEAALAGTGAGGGISAVTRAPLDIIDGVTASAAEQRKESNLTNIVSSAAASLNDATDPEAVAAARESLTSLLPQVEAQVAAKQKAFDKFSNPAIQGQLEFIDEINASLKEEGITEERTAELEGAVAQMEASIIGALPPKGVAALEQLRTIQTTQADLASAIQGDQVAAENLSKADTTTLAAQEATEELPALVELADRDVSTLTEEEAVVSRSSGERIISLAMASPELVDSELATRMADNPVNSYTPAERTMLRSFAAAQVASHAAKGIEGVKQDVFKGDSIGGYKGIEEYQQIVGKAMSGSNPDIKRANAALRGITRFAQSQANKLAVAEKAYAEALESGGMQQWLREGDSWVLSDRKMTNEEVEDNGGMSIHKGSGVLVDNIRTEAAAISTMATALGDVIAMRSPAPAKPSKTEAPVKPPATTAPAKPAAPVTPQADVTPQPPEAKATKPAPTPPPPGQPKVAPTKGAETTAASVPPTTSDMSTYVNHSGGAKGADSAWDSVGRQHGVSDQRHYQKDKTPLGNTTITPEQHQEGLVKAKEAAKALGRNWSNKPYIQGLLSRNWQQVKNADAVFAVAENLEGEYVAGGTGYAVAMARAEGKPVFVYDQSQDAWFKSVEGGWEATSVPSLTPNFAGIGTRNLSAKGQQAIEAVYAATQAKLNTPVEQASSEAEVAEAPSEPTRETGALTLFDEVPEIPEGTFAQIHRKINWLQHWFNQKTGEREARGMTTADEGRALVNVFNFVSEARKDPKLLAKYMPKDLLVNSEIANGTFEFFGNLVNTWGEVIQSQLLKVSQKDRDFFYKTPFNFFVNHEGETPSVDENLIAAMTVAGLSWLTDKASSGTYKTDSETAALMGWDSKRALLPAESAFLRQFDDRTSVVHSSLGREVMQALGLKLKDPDNTPMDVQPLLEAAIGARIISLLSEKGLVNEYVYSGQNLVDEHNIGLSPEEAKQNYLFLALKRHTPKGEKYAQFSPEVMNLVEMTQGTNNVLQKMFGINNPASEPLRYQPTHDQELTSNTTQHTPTELNHILQADVKRPYKINRPIELILTKLSRDSINNIAGVVPDTEIIPADLRDGIKAANDAIHRTIDNTLGYFNALWEYNEAVGTDQKLYMAREIWKHHRVGMVGNILNPMADKFSRGVVSMVDWEHTIDLTDPASAPMVDQLKLAVMEAMGEKTDNKDDSVVIEKFDAWIKEPHVQEALEAVRQAQEDDLLTDAQEEAITTLVAAGGEKMHSLSGLVAAAAYDQASKQVMETGEGEFTTTFNREVDGKTNGAMLANLQLAAFRNMEEMVAFLERGGFYTEDSPYTAYHEFRGDTEASNKDLYEATSKTLLAAVKLSLTEESQGDYDTLVRFTGTLEAAADEITSAGRNLMKGPDTQVVYGSGIDTAITGMANAFVEKVLGRLQKLANGRGKTDTIASYINDVNAILAARGVQQLIPADSTAVQLAANKLSTAQVKALTGWYTNLLGDQIKSTMEHHFGDFMLARDTMNTAAGIAYEMFNAVYQVRREAKIQELIQTEDIPKTGKNNLALYDLTPAQEKEVFDTVLELMPIAHSPFSHKSGDLQQGVSPMKSSKSNGNSLAYKGEQKINGETQLLGEHPQKKHYTTFFGDTQGYADPGVALLVLLTQSLDSAISANAYAKLAALNVHDAHIIGLKNILQGGQNLNKATFEQSRDYSLPGEVDTMFERVLTQFVEAFQSGELDGVDLAPVRKKVESFTYKLYPNGSLSKDDLDMARKYFLTNPLQNYANVLRTRRLKADQMRLEYMGTLSSIDQYSMQNGTYTVNDGDKQGVKDNLEALKTIPRSVQVEGLDGLDRVVSNAKTKKDAATSPEVVAEAEVAPTVPAATAWGTLGTSPIKHNPLLVSFFEANPNPQFKDVLKVLRGAIEAMPDSGQKKLFLTLWKQVVRSIPPSTQVQYVTKDSPLPAHLEGTEVNRIRGMFSFGADLNVIYVKSPDFRFSGLTAEMLLHELVHGAIAREIQYNLDNPGQNTRASKLVENLEKLRLEAVAYAASQGLDKKYVVALSDIQEFAAWGMTNPGFQKDVLSAFTAKRKGRKNALISGMQAFISNVREIFYKAFSNGTTEEAFADTALMKLVENVSGLMAQAEADQGGKAGVSGNLAMAYDAEPSLQDVFDALGHDKPVEPGFVRHLESLLNTLVRPLHGPAEENRAAAMERMPADLLDAVLTGQANVPTVVTGIPMSAQEAFVADQVAATLRAAVDSTDRTVSMAYRELRRVYTEVAGSMTVDDFLGPQWGTATKEEAETLRSRILDIHESEGPNDYLTRFAALTVAYKPFNELLKRPTTRQQRELSTLGWADRVLEIIERIGHYLVGKVNGTFDGQDLDARVQVLSQHLVNIEAKYMSRRNNKVIVALEQGEVLFNRASDAARAGVSKVANSSYIMGSKHTAIRSIGVIADTVGQDRVDDVVAVGQKLRNQIFEEREGFIASMVSEVRGLGHQMLLLLRMAKKNEQHRHNLINWTAANVLESYANKGKDLTQDEKNALALLMRSDASGLTEAGMSLDTLLGLLADDVKLATQISRLRRQIKVASPHSDMILRRADALGKYMVTGKATIHNMMLNSNNIARMYLTRHSASVKDADVARLTPLIDQLASLKALQAGKEGDRKLIHAVLSREMARTDRGNGIDFTLRLHTHLKQEAKEKLFEGDPVLVIKGYTPEIHNPHTEVVAVDELTGSTLEEQGWTRVNEKDPLAKDPLDPTKVQRHLYVLKNRGLKRRDSGILSMRGEGAKGSKVSGDIYSQTNGVSPLNEARTHRINLQGQALEEAALSGRRSSTKSGEFMVPTLNQHGQAANYRYQMNFNTRDTVLERNNSFELLLGTLEGNTFDKISSQEQNQTVIEALHKDWKDNHKDNPEAYMFVSMGSREPGVAEDWRLIPDRTKDIIQATYGTKGMWIRKDQYDLVVGSRKYTLANMFDKKKMDQKDPFAQYNDERRNAAEEVFVWLLEDFFGLDKKAALRVRQAEDTWQELTRVVKDILVIRTGLTLYGNIMSNFTVLALNGVPPRDMIRNHWVAWRGAKEYRKDSEELHQLETELSAGSAINPRKNQQRIRQLKDSIARNPTRELIEAGMLPSIVEDVVVQEDTVQYDTLLEAQIKKQTAWIPQQGKDLANLLLVNPGSAGHRLLSHVTQMSDFTARYTLYQHLTQRKRAPLDTDSAMKHISDAFVNYDIPSGRTLQYLNDMGFLMFTKYYLRIQRVIFNTVREQPARAMMLMSLDMYFSGLQSILDSSMIGRLGNPMELGALQLPTLFDDIGTINLLGEILP